MKKVLKKVENMLSKIEKHLCLYSDNEGMLMNLW